jgi:mannose-6-phosphate isomerase-like protein (cupin superfamily)
MTRNIGGVDGAGWTAARLDEVEALPWQGTELIWRPLRAVLKTHIAGMAAYTADRVGQEIVEGHTEISAGRGHEEVYVVLHGRATFTLGEVEVDAPTGTFVRVDPQVHRRAVAAEPDTAVLALGGPATFQPSASEWIERARAYAHSDPARARAVVDELEAVRPHSRGVGIGEAILALAAGDRAAAEAALSALLDREPDLREALAADPDLGPLVSAL